MSETYTTGLDAWMPVSWQVDIGQVFTPRETHYLEYIDLQLNIAVLFIVKPLEVYNCDITGQPLGDPISFSTKYTFLKETILLPQRVRFRMSEALLQEQQRYIIVARHPFPLPFTTFWGYDSGSQTYMPRGWRMTHPMNDPTWTPHYDQCHIFAEFGTPPLPKPEPEPPIDRFAIPGITYTHYDIGLVIRIPTTVPCHLTCYYTDKTPLKHHTSRTVRGLKVPWQTYFCFVAWKEVEQSEAGDTLYHTFHFAEWPYCLKIPASLTFSSLKDIAPFWEPWGSALEDNYSWVLIADPLPPAITFDKGVINLDFTGTPHSGIIWNAPADTIPLVDPLGQPLHLLTNNTEYQSINPAENIVNAISLRKDNQFITLYLTIKGTLIGPFSGSYGYGHGPGYDYAWLFIGTGVNDINLVDFFQRAAIDLGIDTDPSGWYVNLVEIAHRDLLPLFESWLKNDFIALYHPFSIVKEGRWFTFRGEVDLENVPSVGPIFQHCHPGGLPRDVILRPNAPGDLCTIWREVGAPCPNHYLNVDEVIPDEDTTYVYNLFGATNYRSDLYNIPTATLGKIDSLRVYSRMKRIGGYAYAFSAYILIKTHGTIYRSIHYNSWGTSWATAYYEWTLNPFTNQPWTQAEIDDLQIGIMLRCYWGVGWVTSAACTQLYASVRRGIEGGPD